MRLPEAVVFDTDNRCYQLRLAGMSYRDIAKALDCSSSRAYNGVQRSIERISAKLAEDNRDTHQMELDRLNAMFAQLWPYTMERRVETDEGKTVKVPPSMDAIDRCLKIMDRRAKLMGLDTQVFTVNSGRDAISVGPAQKELGEITPMEESMTLIRMFAEAGVFDAATMSKIKRETGLDIVDVEVIEDSATPQRMLNNPDADGEPFFEGMPEDPDESTGGDLM